MSTELALFPWAMKTLIGFMPQVLVPTLHVVCSRHAASGLAPDRIVLLHTACELSINEVVLPPWHATGKHGVALDALQLASFCDVALIDMHV